MLEVKNVG